MKILIVDDHPVVREGLAAMLAHSGPDTNVLQARDASEGLACIDAHNDIDALLLDLAMPGMDGISAIAEFVRRRPELPIVVLSSSEDPADIRQALRQGAQGYIPKSTSAKTLLPALQFVLSGNVYVPPSILALMDDKAGGSSTAETPSWDRLTDRQLDVLKHLCSGRSNKEIAAELTLSEKTVKAHITAIFKSLGVINRMQAANAARQSGLI